MPAGPKPKPDGTTVHRNPLVHDWTEVVAVPYAGERPAIGRAPAATKRWWTVISTMPHCVLWTPADWQFAVDTVRIHAAFARGDMVRAQELRVREKVMGTTLDARRDLRIRYVDEVSAPAASVANLQVSDFVAERTRRLMEDADAS